MASHYSSNAAIRSPHAASPLKLLWVMMALALLAVAAKPVWSAESAQGAVIVVQVNGMSCPFCTYGLRKELLTVPGVKSVLVSLRKSHATVTLDPGTTVTDAQIRHAIHEAGFSPAKITGPAGGH